MKQTAIWPEGTEKVREALKEKVSIEERTIAEYKAGIMDYEVHEALYRSRTDSDGYIYYKEEGLCI